MPNKAKDKVYDTNIFISNLERYLAINRLKKIDVANAIDVSTGTISDWSKGRSFPSINILKKLADYLGIRISDLIEEEYLPLKRISKEEQEILDLYAPLSNQKKLFFKKMLESMDF